MRRLRRFAEPAITAIIVIVLGTQAIAGLVDTGRWGWPILAYPMYEEAHYDGERILYDARTHIVLADGTRVELTRDELGMSFWIYWQNVVQPIYNGGDLLKPLAPLIAQVCRRFDGRVARLEIEDMGVAIRRDGPVFGLPPVILGSTDVECSS